MGRKNCEERKRERDRAEEGQLAEMLGRRRRIERHVSETDASEEGRKGDLAHNLTIGGS